MAPRIEAPAFAKSSSAPIPHRRLAPQSLRWRRRWTILPTLAAREISPGPAIPALYLLRSTSPAACTSRYAHPLPPRETPPGPTPRLWPSPAIRSRDLRFHPSAAADSPPSGTNHHNGQYLCRACAQLMPLSLSNPLLPGRFGPRFSGFWLRRGICACRGGNGPERQRSREIARIVRRGMNWFSFPRILVRSVGFPLRCGFIPKEALYQHASHSFWRLVLRSTLRIEEAISDARHLHYFCHIVDAHNVRPVQDARGNRGGSAPDSLFR